MRSLSLLVAAAVAADALSFNHQRPLQPDQPQVHDSNSDQSSSDYWQKLWEERGRPTQEEWQKMEDSNPDAVSFRRERVEEWSLIQTEPGSSSWVTESEKWELKRVRVPPIYREAVELTSL